MPEDNQRLIVMPEAQADLLKAMYWYDTQSRGLSEDFQSAVENCLDRIKQNPQQFRTIRRGIRRCIISRFPYIIYFYAAPKEIAILSVRHQKRHPRFK